MPLSVHQSQPRAPRTVVVGLMLLVLASLLLIPARGVAAGPESRIMSGRVVSPDGDPIEGQPVCVELFADTTCLAVTDDQGRYEIKVDKFYPAPTIGFPVLPVWPIVSIGRDWDDNPWRTARLETVEGPEVVTVLDRRETVAGGVRTEAGNGLGGVQVCAAAARPDGGAARGETPTDAICRTTDDDGSYKVPVSAPADVFVWDRRFLPADAGATQRSSEPADVKPGQRSQLLVKPLHRTRAVTIRGDVGKAGVRVCVSVADRRSAKVCSKPSTPQYRVRIRPWVLDPDRASSIRLKVGIGARQREPVQVSLDPGRAVELNWGALTVAMPGQPTYAFCVSSSQALPPTTFGIDTSPWEDYCEVFKGFPASFPKTEQSYFFRGEHRVKVAFERNYQAIWVGDNGMWSDAKEITIGPGRHRTVVIG